MRHHSDKKKWTPATLHDRHLEQRAARAQRRSAALARVATGKGRKEDLKEDLAPETAPEPVPAQQVRCACGRLESTGMMVDVRAIPVEIRGAQEAACCGCWTQWIRTGKIARHEWIAKLGGPPDLVARHRRKGNPHIP